MADGLLEKIADYVTDYEIDSEEAYETAQYCLMDTIGCGLLALRYPECAKLIRPVVPGATLYGGARVPGTQLELDPVRAAFCTGTAVRWLDYNDTWLAAEWGHPSDNLGGILAVCDYESRRRISEGRKPLYVSDVLTAAIKAHEIQGALALENSFNRLGLDHVLLVRVATAAVTTHLVGGGREEIMSAVSNAFLDGGALRTYRHAPNTGSRKSWAAGDATSRGVWLALTAMAGEMGYPTALSAEGWGFEDVVLGGSELGLSLPLGSYVMENVLFKISYPAEFHAQTAAEAAVSLHAEVSHRLDDIESITISTQEPARRIIDKTGPLRNPADRDHCLQYVTALGLIFGEITADHYEEYIARDPRIDTLRGKMEVVEDARYSADYLDTDKRSIANAIQVRFVDSATAQAEVEYPIGHRRRRAEGMTLLEEKFEANVRVRFPEQRVGEILSLFHDYQLLESTRVDDLLRSLTT